MIRSKLFWHLPLLEMIRSSSGTTTSLQIFPETGGGGACVSTAYPYLKCDSIVTSRYHHQPLAGPGVPDDPRGRQDTDGSARGARERVSQHASDLSISEAYRVLDRLLRRLPGLKIRSPIQTKADRSRALKDALVLHAAFRANAVRKAALVGPGKPMHAVDLTVANDLPNSVHSAPACPPVHEA